MAVTKRLGSGSAIMSNGLIISPRVLGAQVTSLDLHFEPSVAIIAKKLKLFGMEIKDFRTPLRRAIQQVIIPSIQMNFHKHGRPRWARLEDDTVRHKGGNMKPLQRTGALREGMKAIDIWTIRRDNAFLADLPAHIWYGKVHQAGFGSFDVQDEFGIEGKDSAAEIIGKRNFGEEGSIPARPFVMIQPQDEILIEQVFDLWIEERIVKAGLK